MVCYVVSYYWKNVTNPNLFRIPSDVNEFLFSQRNIGRFLIRTGRKNQTTPKRGSSVVNYFLTIDGP